VNAACNYNNSSFCFPSPVPALPAGHPFSNVQSFFYWSATTFVGDNVTGAWGVFLGPTQQSIPTGFVDDGAKDFDAFVWCVRGGQGIEGFFR
jgi:hypothetical protein